MAECICSWPRLCDGAGFTRCRDANFCYCQCGCASECFGCARCDADDDYGDDDLADEEVEQDRKEGP